MDKKLAGQALLSRMADLLDSDGINYTVFLKSYSCAAEGVSQIENIVKKLVGHDVVLGNVRDISLAQLMQDLCDCLGYVGDDGAGPGPSTLNLPEFSNLLREVSSDITQVYERSGEVKSFRFLEGHPAYPVFWEFAFLFLGNDGYQLIVGSSSD